MAIVNGNYAKLQDSYLFTDIAKRVAAFTAAHPEKKIIKMGIGDVTLPLAPCVVDAMKKAVEELGHKETFAAMARNKVMSSCMKPFKSIMPVMV